MEEQNTNSTGSTDTNKPTENTTGTPNDISPPQSNVKIVGVRFKRAGRIYYFDPSGLELKIGDWVVIETARGLEVARVVIDPKQVLSNEVEMPLKPLIRKAEPKEIQHNKETEAKEKEALTECAKMITHLGLSMKLLSAEYSLDGGHITFFFSAAERVDFRELVRELVGHFKVRVELRQVGARDEAKMCGGFGRCGRPLCCATFLSEFVPISIKMAKEQDLPLNPLKISGVCGRLLCCLAYEHDFYREMKGRMPRDGQTVATSLGTARVVGSNPLKGTVVVELESEVTVELPVGDVKVISPPVVDKIEPAKNNEEIEEPKENGENPKL